MSENNMKWCMSHPKDGFLARSYCRPTRVLPRSYSVPTPILLPSYSAPALGNHPENTGKWPENKRVGECKSRQKEIDRTMHQRTLTPCPSPGRRGEQLALTDRRERKPPVAGHASAVPGEGMEVYPCALPASRHASTVTSSSACAWQSRMMLLRRSLSSRASSVSIFTDPDISRHLQVPQMPSRHSEPTPTPNSSANVRMGRPPGDFCRLV